MTTPGTLTVGAMFAGYGGLDLAVEDVFGASLSWVAENDPGASRILAARFPDVPNLGDVTTLWDRLFDQPDPVDIITGGSPCQDLSHAGKRAGMRPGTRSGLWAAMCDAVDILRPRFVVWENVRGALNARADSAVEPCPVCVGDHPGTTLRALGRVLGDLAELGYDAAWTGIRASDVGAPHGRYRVFVLAWDATADPRSETRQQWPGLRAQDTARDGRGLAARGGWTADTDALTMLPTPTSTDHKASGSTYGATETHHAGTTLTAATVRHADTFGQYAPAIARWEAVIGRSAPAPTEPTGKGGAHRLSPRFVEWMQGLPDGWVTDTRATRSQQLQALGNGVVPQQAATALRHLLALREFSSSMGS